MSVAQLQAALDAVDAALSTFDQTRTTYSVGGESMQHDGHYESLLKRRAELKQLIINEGGAGEFHTIVLG